MKIPPSAHADRKRFATEQFFDLAVGDYSEQRAEQDQTRAYSYYDYGRSPAVIVGLAARSVPRRILHRNAHDDEQRRRHHRSGVFAEKIYVSYGSRKKQKARRIEPEAMHCKHNRRNGDRIQSSLKKLVDF